MKERILRVCLIEEVVGDVDNNRRKVTISVRVQFYFIKTLQRGVGRMWIRGGLLGVWCGSWLVR